MKKKGAVFVSPVLAEVSGEPPEEVSDEASDELSDDTVITSSCGRVWFPPPSGEKGSGSTFVAFAGAAFPPLGGGLFLPPPSSVGGGGASLPFPVSVLSGAPLVAPPLSGQPLCR